MSSPREKKEEKREVRTAAASALPFSLVLPRGTITIIVRVSYSLRARRQDREIRASAIRSESTESSSAGAYTAAAVFTSDVG